MARKSKDQIVETETTEKLNNHVVESDLVGTLMKQVEELQKQLIAIQKKENTQNSQPISTPEETPKETKKIDGREYIRVMSLSNIPLNLTTEPMGRGRVFQFAKFGEVKKIMFDDLVKIAYNHPTFLQQGRFLILDPAAVQELGYEDDYAKILTKNKIEAVLENKDGAIDLYKSANEVQKRVIHEFLIRKIRDDLASVDTALIVSIKKTSGIDLIVEAENIKSVLQVEE